MNNQPTVIAKRKPTTLMENAKQKSRVLSMFEVSCLARCAVLGNSGAIKQLQTLQIAPIVVVK